MATKLYQIAGRVQGVFFRATTQQRATELGLVGWVRNLPDGRVEAMATGSESALQEFEKFLWQGPEQAHVDDVSVQSLDEPVNGSHDNEFVIR